MAKPGPFAGMSRREFFAKSAAAGGAAMLASWAGPVIERAYAADPAGMGGLGDIEHIVLLMQENRSFDHYFGTLPGVRGFGDRFVAPAAALQAGGRVRRGRAPRTDARWRHRHAVRAR